MIQAAFLDRDGTINETILKYSRIHEKDIDDCPYNSKELSFRPGVIEGVRRLREAGLKIIIISNQPGIAQGKFSLDNLRGVNGEICSQLGLNEEDLYICLHREEDECECRKPKPALVYKARDKFGINLSSSFVVGDSWRDILLAENAKIGTSIFVERPKIVGKSLGNQADSYALATKANSSYCTVGTFDKAVEIILGKL